MNSTWDRSIAEQKLFIIWLDQMFGIIEFQHRHQRCGSLLQIVSEWEMLNFSICDDKTRCLWTKYMYEEYLEAGFLGLFPLKVSDTHKWVQHYTSDRGQDCIPPNSISQVTKSWMCSPVNIRPPSGWCSPSWFGACFWICSIQSFRAFNRSKMQQRFDDIWYVSITLWTGNSSSPEASGWPT